MTPSNVTLSVTITSYNYAQFLNRNIKSILNQTFTDFEVIIVDDASTDSSIEIIKNYARQDSRIQLIEHTHTKGATVSLIEASNLARGKYLVNIDSDDWITNPDAFALQLAMFSSDPEIVLVYSLQVMNHINQSKYHRRTPYTQDTVLPGYIAAEKVMSFFVAHTGTMIRRDFYLKVGGYNPNYRYAIDLKLWIDLCNEGKIGYINKQLYLYNLHTGSMSHKADPDLWQKELLDALESGFSGPMSFYFKRHPALKRTLVKRALVAGSLHYIFNDNYSFGWKLFFSSLKKHPIDTLLQKATLVLIFRTFFREEGYKKVQRLFLKVEKLDS